jgi:hypothetical protein
MALLSPCSCPIQIKAYFLFNPQVLPSLVPPVLQCAVPGRAAQTPALGVAHGDAHKQDRLVLSQGRLPRALLSTFQDSCSPPGCTAPAPLPPHTPAIPGLALLQECLRLQAVTNPIPPQYTYTPGLFRAEPIRDRKTRNLNKDARPHTWKNLLLTQKPSFREVCGFKAPRTPRVSCWKTRASITPFYSKNLCFSHSMNSRVRSLQNVETQDPNVLSS